MANKAPITILFIDDEKICHKVLELSMINYPSYRMLSAYSSKEAWELLEAHSNQINIIVSDVHMEDYSGQDLFRDLQKHEKYRDIPFILQSGIIDQSTKLKYHNGENVKVICKPYKPQDLFKLVNSLSLINNSHM